MGRVSSDVKLSALERLRNEPDNFRAIADDAGVSLATLLKWQQTEEGEPKGVAPPQTSEEKDKRTRKTRLSRKPVTEKTAGLMCAGLFSIAAAFDGGTWFLTDEEREALSEPLADSLRLLPSPVANAINDYSAPGVFATALGVIVAHKIRMSREAKRAARRPRPVVAPTPFVTPQRNPEAQPQPFVGQPSSNLDQSLVDAVNAARSGLSGLDTPDAAESAFSYGRV